jgi:hypothetical protein
MSSIDRCGVKPGRGSDVMMDVDTMRRGLRPQARCREGRRSGEKAAAVQGRMAQTTHGVLLFLTVFAEVRPACIAISYAAGQG